MNKPRKVRWLKLDKPIEYRGKAHPAWHGWRCVVTAVAVQRKGTPRNLRIRFVTMRGYPQLTVVVPLGTLRNVEETEE